MEVTDDKGVKKVYNYGLSPGSDTQLDVSDTHLYVGGMSPDVSSVKTGLTGCVAQLRAAKSLHRWTTLNLQQDAIGGVGISSCAL